jgi:hypothetical protein
MTRPGVGLPLLLMALVGQQSLSALVRMAVVDGRLE